MFKNGQTSVTHEEQSRCPFSSITKGNTKQILALILNNRRDQYVKILAKNKAKIQTGVTIHKEIDVQLQCYNISHFELAAFCVSVFRSGFSVAT
jgi:hypothetical protein